MLEIAGGIILAVALLALARLAWRALVFLAPLFAEHAAERRAKRTAVPRIEVPPGYCATLQCGGCGARNLIDAAICVECGAELVLT